MPTSPTPTPDASLWRFGIISEFLHASPDGRTLAERLALASQREWNHPSGRLLRIQTDTLRHWIYRYRKDGIAGLASRPRSDTGATAIPRVLQEALRSLRGQNPHYTTERLLRELVEAGQWTGKRPSRSAFYRFAETHGLGRVPPGAEAPREAHAFAFAEFGQMWIADFLHGPKVRQGRQLHKTYLLAILDDASRFVVHARFYWAEGTESLLDGLCLAIRRFGIPQRFYTDNGAAFRSDHLKLVAARLGMHLPHTPAYRPQGRGKVERFFRTVRDQWLSGYEAVSLEALNLRLGEWLDDYHHRLHEALERSPLAARLAILSVVRPQPEATDLERKFLMQSPHRIARNGTVSLLRKTFDVKNALPGQVVTVFYLPWNLAEVYIGEEMVPARPVTLDRNAHRFTNNPLRGKETK